MKLSNLSKRARLHELLGAYGDNRIDADQFERLMTQYDLNDDDIQRYCEGKELDD